jgi:hypothetical protein
MNLARVDEALLQARQELIEDPRQGCRGPGHGPHIRHLAQLAIGSASEGFTAERWRFWIVDGSGPEAAALLDMGNPACAAWPLSMARLKESNDD